MFEIWTLMNHKLKVMKKKSKKAATTNRAGDIGTTITKSKSPLLPLPQSLLLHEKDNLHPSLDALQDGADVYVARNFLSATECRAWIDFVEQSGELEHVSHPATRYIAHRECSRFQRNNAEAWHVADKIFQRLVQTGILQTFESNLSTPPAPSCCSSCPRGTKSYRPVACNGNLRLYKYETGMSFGRHVDECNSTMRGQTEVTILIYLSDCQGGATRFYNMHSNNTTTHTSEVLTASKRKQHISSCASFAFVPETGSILLHVHGDKCLEHEADPVLSGIKYVLRTDLVYSEVENNSDNNRWKSNNEHSTN